MKVKKLQVQNLAIKCPSCKRVYVPPRRVCGRCFIEMSDFVELPPRGTLTAFTVLMFSFVDPDTGKERPVPYGYGYVRFEGAHNTLPHFWRRPTGKRSRSARLPTYWPSISWSRESWDNQPL
jgi:uncharacterized OB-fold protein